MVPAFERPDDGPDSSRTRICQRDVQEPSWTARDVELPIYYQWRFRTGENEDFEELVKRSSHDRQIRESAFARWMERNRAGEWVTARTSSDSAD